MASKINCNSIIAESIVDGPGLRYVIFVQGCPHHCPGCHNPQTHDFVTNTLYSVQEIYQDYIQNPLLSGITFSGGEPFCQAGMLAELGNRIKASGGTVITYSGFTYEKLLEMSNENKEIEALLHTSDYLIDGPYIDSLRNLTLPFRGSENQRIWDLRDKIILEHF